MFNTIQRSQMLEICRIDVPARSQRWRPPPSKIAKLQLQGWVGTTGPRYQDTCAHVFQTIYMNTTHCMTLLKCRRCSRYADLTYLQYHKGGDPPLVGVQGGAVPGPRFHMDVIHVVNTPWMMSRHPVDFIWCTLYGYESEIYI